MSIDVTQISVTRQPAKGVAGEPSYEAIGFSHPDMVGGLLYSPEQLSALGEKTLDGNIAAARAIIARDTKPEGGNLNDMNVFKKVYQI